MHQLNNSGDNSERSAGAGEFFFRCGQHFPLQHSRIRRAAASPTDNSQRDGPPGCRVRKALLPLFLLSYYVNIYFRSLGNKYLKSSSLCANVFSTLPDGSAN